MGMGVWTHEDIVYDPTTGAVLTNRTWVPANLLCASLCRCLSLYVTPSTPQEQTPASQVADGPLTTEAIFLNCSTTPNQFSF
uniref:Uncharacterized protein n=1 Tax=Timema genevievae TaxID=629358 RepID=A0A7R9K728_TIMGE|nr:unnamed protein product [Timema genevievae]